MSFLFPRVISITRPADQIGVGALGYGGQVPGNETSIATGIPASIQSRKTGAPPAGHLPSDTSKRTEWRVMFKLALGVVLERDIITDDLGTRYQVISAYWNSLGYQCTCEKLEV